MKNTHLEEELMQSTIIMKSFADTCVNQSVVILILISLQFLFICSHHAYFISFLFLGLFQRININIIIY